MTSAEQTKEERIENEQRLAEYKLTRRLSAMEKKDAVKKSMMQSQRKLDSYRMQKIQAVSAPAQSVRYALFLTAFKL